MHFQRVGANALVKLFIEPFIYSVFNVADTGQIREILLQLVTIGSHRLCSIIVANVLLVRQMFSLYFGPPERLSLQCAHQRHVSYRNFNKIICANRCDWHAVRSHIRNAVEFLFFLVDPLPTWLTLFVAVEAELCNLRHYLGGALLSLSQAPHFTNFTLQRPENLKPENSVHSRGLTLSISNLLAPQVSLFQLELPAICLLE